MLTSQLSGTPLVHRRAQLLLDAYESASISGSMFARHQQSWGHFAGVVLHTALLSSNPACLHGQQMLCKLRVLWTVTGIFFL